MNRKTIYIAGPMSGMQGNNYPAFMAAEKWLEAQGWQPINPAKFDAVFGDNPTGRLLDAVCKSECAAIPFLDAIYLIKGWEKSKGARAELAVALAHGKQILLEGAGE
jgi:hypothetical protein